MRYLPERQLPDKAIDLIDEAASALRLEIDSVPKELDAVQRADQPARDGALRAGQGEGPREQGAPAGRRGGARRPPRDASRRCAPSGRPSAPRSTTSRALKEQLERARERQQLLERQGNLEEAARLRYEVLPGLEQKIAEAEARLARQGERRLLKEEVGEEEIAEVVARWTGIPVSKMLESEGERLAPHGGPAAHPRRRPGPGARGRVRRDPPQPRRPHRRASRPYGSFLFVGPTGVGKTETARALAEFLFDDEQAMVRIDMSRVPGAPHGVAPDRRAARLRRLRRGRPAHGGGPPPALRRRALRRGREGAPGGLQHPAAGARRRPPDGRPRPHRGLHEHGRDHDEQPGQPGRDGAGPVRRRDRAPHAGRAARALPTRVPEPDRRHHRLPPSRPGRDPQDRRHPDRQPRVARLASAASRSR